MKRATALIMALLLCLGLCACDEDENKTAANIHPDYVGEWKCMRVTSSAGDSEEYIIILNEDGTGSYDNINGKWRYSEENDWAVLEIDLGNVVMKLAEAEGTTVLKCYGDTYYRAAEFAEFGTETIKITVDNWQEYFTLQFCPDPQYNDSGEITDIHWNLYFQMSSAAARVLTGEVSGAYLLSEPLVHSAWCSGTTSGGFTYNFFPLEDADSKYTINLVESEQDTFDVTLEQNKQKSVRTSKSVWSCYSDSIKIEGNEISMFVALYSQLDLTHIEGSITVFK